MMDKIWEFLKLIPLFIYKWTDFALQWLYSHLSPVVEEFTSSYNSDMIIFIGCAVILILSIVCWVVMIRKAFDDDDVAEHDDRAGVKKVVGFISLFLYAFVLIWIVALLTHPLNDAGSWLLNDVFEQKALISFSEGVTMLPKLPAGSTITLSNFLYWHDLLAIGAVFVLVKFALTAFFNLITLHIFKLIRFLILTASFIILGLIGGSFLTFLTESDSLLMQLISMPVFLIVYFVPMLVIWVPVAAVYGGPVLYVLGTILNLFSSALGVFGIEFGGGPVTETEYYDVEYSKSSWGGVERFKIRDSSGLVTGVFYFWGGMPL